MAPEWNKTWWLPDVSSGFPPSKMNPSLSSTLILLTRNSIYRVVFEFKEINGLGRERFTQTLSLVGGEPGCSMGLAYPQGLFLRAFPTRPSQAVWVSLSLGTPSGNNEQKVMAFALLKHLLWVSSLVWRKILLLIKWAHFLHNLPTQHNVPHICSATLQLIEAIWLMGYEQKHDVCYCLTKAFKSQLCEYHFSFLCNND